MKPRKLNVLLACEYSGTFRRAFQALGCNAVSVDLDPSDDNSPDHFQQDIVAFLNATPTHYDLVMAFPPCTHLATSGAKHFPAKIKDGRQQQAIDFFMYFVNLPRIAPKRFPLVVIENSVGVMSTKHRKPDHILQPYQFGDPHSKRTCFWVEQPQTPITVKPKLYPTHAPPYDKGEFYISPKTGKRMPAWYNMPESKDRGKKRSLAFPGMAAAVAHQLVQHMLYNPEIPL